MTDEEIFRNALSFASVKHDGQYRKGGEPYIIHPVMVCHYICEQGYGLDYQLTALFHDLLEDTDTTDEEILAHSNPTVLEATKLLTKYPGYNMDEYVAKIAANPIAKAVKVADRLHNLRSALVRSEEFKRRYILETIDYYVNWSDDIKRATKDLAMALETPIPGRPFLYEPIETWLGTEE